MKVSLDNLGSVGLITDVDPHALPPQAITAGVNFSCKNGYVSPAAGYSEYKDLASITGDAHYVVPLQLDTEYYWIAPVDVNGDGVCEKIYRYDGASLTDVTRASGAYTGTSGAQWNGCNLLGTVVMNNGVDAPQVFGEGDSNCVNLSYDGVDDWEAISTEGYLAKVIRSHGNFLFALNITDNGARYRTMVHWSSPAIPGDPSPSWDYTSLTEQSNRLTLAQTNGKVIDGLSLRDTFIVYKEDSVYAFSMTGEAIHVFRNHMIFSDRGIYAQDCACDIGGKHFVVGDGRVYTHDGVNVQDLLYGRNADRLFGSIDQANYKRTFVVHNRGSYEVWICYPSVGSDTCDSAMIYNYAEKTWTTRKLPGIRHATVGLTVDAANSDTWDYETDMTWDAEDEMTWGAQLFSPIGDALIGAGTSLYHLDTGTLINGEAPDVYVERTDLMLDGPQSWNNISKVYPRTGGSDSFQLYIGKQTSIGDNSVTWSAPATVTPGVTSSVSFRVNGPVHAWKVIGHGDWRLYGLDITAQPSGRR